MDPVRIHLAHMSPLVRRMITDLLARERDFKIVGWADQGENPLVAARAQGANLIITQGKAARFDQYLNPIVRAAPLTILALEPSDSSSTSISLVRREFTFNGGGAKALANVVRQAMRVV